MKTYRVIASVKIRAGEEIKEFQPDRVIRLPEEAARKLLEAGKIKPEPEPTPANNEEYFRSVARRIAQNYQAGTIAYIRTEHLERWKQFSQAEDRINSLWDKNFLAFQRAANEWLEISLELAKLFIEKIN